MAVRVLLQFVKPTMRLAAPICDPDGRLLAGAGTQLRAGVQRVLRRMAMQSVLVTEAEDVPSWGRIRPLSEELAELDHRIAPAARHGALAELHAAIARHLTGRAARLATEPLSSGKAEGTER